MLIARAKSPVGDNGVFRVQVLRFHEPPLLVVADRQNRKPDPAEPRGDIVDKLSVTRIPGKIDLPARRIDNKSTPERPVFHKRRPPRAVPCRNEGERDAALT